jgi:hypothetical protein
MSGLLVPEDIFHPLVSVSSRTAKINISLILIKQNGMNDCCLKLDEDYSSYSHDENRTSSNTNKALCWEYVTPAKESYTNREHKSVYFMNTMLLLR